MRKFIESIKVEALIENSIKDKNLYFWFVVMFLMSAELCYSASYKINERTRIYTREIPGDSLVLQIDNDFSIPVSAKLTLELMNLEGDSTLQLSAIVPAKITGYTLAKFKKRDATAPYTCSYKWKIVLGDVSKVPDEKYLYAYPFEKGGTYKVSQGPGGVFSHKDMFAYDFLMPIGTPVTAARDGIVALIKSDASIGGPDRKHIEEANFISVYHADGTIANYLHLNTNGVRVKEGQTVQKGEVIGYSGNTGFSSGPHLHFELTHSGTDLKNNKGIAFNWELKPNRLFAYLKRTSN